MLSSSDCESLAVSDLLALEPDAQQRLSQLTLGYTEVAGSLELREAVASRYEHTAPQDVLTLAAAEEASFSPTMRCWSRATTWWWSLPATARRLRLPAARAPP